MFAMAVSPFVDFEQYLYVAPFNAAPGKACVLWDELSHEHPLVLVDRPGFWFSAFEKHVEMSYAFVEALWSAAYCIHPPLPIAHSATMPERIPDHHPAKRVGAKRR